MKRCPHIRPLAWKSDGVVRGLSGWTSQRSVNGCARLGPNRRSRPSHARGRCGGQIRRRCSAGYPLPPGRGDLGGLAMGGRVSDRRGPHLGLRSRSIMEVDGAADVAPRECVTGALVLILAPLYPYRDQLCSMFFLRAPGNRQTPSARSSVGRRSKQRRLARFACPPITGCTSSSAYCRALQALPRLS